jgi:epoxide hydrolase-like predicted phosphatase
MIKAVIFDCFGVLVSDSLKLLVEALESAKQAEIVSIMHDGHRGLNSGPEYSQKVAALLGMTLEEYRAHVANGEVKNRQLMEYITSLKRHYKTAILSNVSIGGIAARFTPDELKAHFDTVVASGEVGFAKPEAQIYELAAERLEVRLDECVFTDDREEYCEGARGVGMQAIYFQNFKQFKRDLEALLPPKPSI